MKINIELDFDESSPTAQDVKRVFERFIDKHFSDEQLFYNVSVIDDAPRDEVLAIFGAPRRIS